MKQIRCKYVTKGERIRKIVNITRRHIAQMKNFK